MLQWCFLCPLFLLFARNYIMVSRTKTDEEIQRNSAWDIENERVLSAKQSNRNCNCVAWYQLYFTWESSDTKLKCALNVFHSNAHPGNEVVASGVTLQISSTIYANPGNVVVASGVFVIIYSSLSLAFLPWFLFWLGLWIFSWLSVWTCSELHSVLLNKVNNKKEVLNSWLEPFSVWIHAILGLYIGVCDAKY